MSLFCCIMGFISKYVFNLGGVYSYFVFHSFGYLIVPEVSTYL